MSNVIKGTFGPPAFSPGEEVDIACFSCGNDEDFSEDGLCNNCGAHIFTKVDLPMIAQEMMKALKTANDMVGPEYPELRKCLRDAIKLAEMFGLTTTGEDRHD